MQKTEVIFRGCRQAVPGSPRRSSLQGSVIALFAWTVITLSNIDFADGWCYRVGECEAWQLKLTIEESEAACCMAYFPGAFEHPTVEPERFWSEAPVEGYDFIPGEKDVPAGRPQARSASLDGRLCRVVPRQCVLVRRSVRSQRHGLPRRLADARALEVMAAVLSAAGGR